MWCLVFFFFKQKTAYEVRISDWSSDVCSSDLRPCRPADATVRRLRRDDRDGDSSTYEKQLPVDDLDLAGSDRGGKRRRSQGGAAGESRADRRNGPGPPSAVPCAGRDRKSVV